MSYFGVPGNRLRLGDPLAAGLRVGFVFNSGDSYGFEAAGGGGGGPGWGRGEGWLGWGRTSQLLQAVSKNLKHVPLV